MGMYDRDWYRADRRLRRVSQPHNPKPEPQPSGVFNIPNLFALVLSFFAVSYLLRAFF